MKPISIFVMHGPNLNLLGEREPEHYGKVSLAIINEGLIQLGDTLAAEVVSFQSNHEGALIDRIHEALHQHVDGIIINPAAFTHTSIAIRDALLGCQIPFVEVHLSNVYRREVFRHKSMLSDAAIGVVTGLGAISYQLALRGIVEYLRHPTIVASK
ncbi:MAG: type II 3-dehydroquinate dehydratase [Mariprofundaceae bacterium]